MLAIAVWWTWKGNCVITVVYCIDVLRVSRDRWFLPRWQHRNPIVVFSVDSSWVFDRLLSSVPGWRKPPWNVPWVRKCGEKRLSGGGREKESKKEVFATNAAGILLFINKSSQQLICKIHFPVWKKKQPLRSKSKMIILKQIPKIPVELIHSNRTAPYVWSL